jgi:hypothetical protein
MHCEARLLYGKELLEPLTATSLTRLREQLLESLSHRVVMLRSLVCSKAVEKYTPDYTIYYAQKFCLFGLRALLLIQNDWNTQRKHVIQQFHADETLLTAKNRMFFQSLLSRWEQKDFPQTLDERLHVLYQTITLVEEIQKRILNNNR